MLKSYSARFDKFLVQKNKNVLNLYFVILTFTWCRIPDLRGAMSAYNFGFILPKPKCSQIGNHSDVGMTSSPGFSFAVPMMLLIY